MDYYDSILCLDYLLDGGSDAAVSRKIKLDAATRDECKNKLEICKMTLASSKETNSPLAEDEKELLKEQIRFVEEKLNVRTADLYVAATSSGILPKSFYLNNALGALAYDQVQQSTSFQVRGRNYSSDNKKVSLPSSHPL